MKNSHIYFFLASMLFVLCNCSIPEVKDAKSGKIVLACDFLFPKDSLLLRKFEKKSNVTIVIKNMTVDSIKAHYKKWKYNSKIDIVLLSSSKLANELTNGKVLNKLPDDLSENRSSLMSYKKDWIAIGINPYVFDYGDSIPKKNGKYHDLTANSNWTTDLNQSELSAFYASVSNHFGDKKKVQAKAWIRKMMTNLEESKKDLKNIPVFALNTFQKMNSENHKYVMPNKNDYGCFYDGYCIGIIRNSKNYAWAEKLVRYFLVENNNEVLSAKLNLFPIFDPKGRSSYDFQNNYPNLHWSSMKKTSKKMMESDRLLKTIRIEIDSSKVSKNKPINRISRPQTNESSEPIQ